MENLQAETRVESPERAKLRELEETGEYVFHGSNSAGIKEFEPRQAYQHLTRDTKVPNDEPAVFASPMADLAIFMSIFSSKENFPKGYRNRYTWQGTGSESNIQYMISERTSEQMGNNKGYVYVFPKDKFTFKNKVEAVSNVPVEPIEVIEVTEKDLPVDIQVKNF